MCRSEQRRAWGSAGLTTGAVLLMASCATTAPPKQQFRSFFIPPVRSTKIAAQEPLAEPPGLTGSIATSLPALDLYAFEKPKTPLPSLPRPADGEFVIRQADQHFNAGKRALEEGRSADARREFNRAIEVLLAAPENAGDRTQIERRLEELTDNIYKYDVDQQNPGDSGDKVSYEKRPLDEILESTFPVEPSLRGRVKEQIQATASQLPLEETDAVISFINFFSSERGKRILAAGLRYSGRYKPMIERILAEEGVPQELIFLAQAESGFQPRAMSNKLCVGLWQFAKFRGNEYGLNQTPLTDDRMDPEKATRAAARHLHDLYSHFGDWYLAMAAYDCGPQCIDHAVARTGYADFWALRRMGVLPQETANYVPAILAMTIIAKNAKDYGLENVEFVAPLEYETVQVSSATHLALVAAALDRPVSEIKELNPAVLHTVAPAGYALHVPTGTVPQLEAAFTVVPTGRRDSWRLHRVEPGDTFAGIAKRYGATASLVSSANGDSLPEAGKLVAVPVSYPGDRVPARAVAKPVARTTAKPAVHVTSGPVATAPVVTAPVATKTPVATTGSKAAAPKTTSVKATPPGPGPTAQKSTAKPQGKAAAPSNGAFNKPRTPVKTAVAAHSASSSASAAASAPGRTSASASAARKSAVHGAAHRVSGA
jgi:membrane-bound lytic murein transglycosylase D